MLPRRRVLRLRTGPGRLNGELVPISVTKPSVPTHWRTGQRAPDHRALDRGQGAPHRVRIRTSDPGPASPQPGHLNVSAAFASAYSSSIPCPHLSTRQRACSQGAQGVAYCGQRNAVGRSFELAGHRPRPCVLAGSAIGRVWIFSVNVVPRHHHPVPGPTPSGAARGHQDQQNENFRVIFSPDHLPAIV
jgi:hypothetical protein